MVRFKQLAILSVLVGLMALMSTACTTGAKLRGQAMEVEALNKSIYNRAYRCAPRELAIAMAHVEFGQYELSRGDFVRATNHLRLAENMARQAQRMSDFEECVDEGVAMVVERAPVVELPDPEPGDADGDGIPDHLDRCPHVPEDFDGWQDEDGCPELDSDGDGIPDHLDQCPYEPEDFDGYQDEDGCPDPDNDGDGIPDILDHCPFEAGPEENHGCPIPEPRLAEIEGDQIRLNQQVFFEFNKDDILPQSFPLLDEVVQILRDHPNINIRVEGHTDSRGSARYNQDLSQRRANSVRMYLMGRGVEAHRIESIGFGQDRPIDDNATEAGRAANRRVEIHITSR